GSYFMSQPSGDVASQGTGGGLVSAKVQGTAKWLAPGSMDVKADGKNIPLLGDAVSNNGGRPANASTLKEMQDAIGVAEAKDLCDAVCAHKNTGRGQSKRAENDFTAKNPSFTSQKNRKYLTNGKYCNPDLANGSKWVEIKMMKGEPYTPNQQEFIK